ncbi:MAG: hypothetical protein QOE89_599, partial [Pseudonocardiales bacterium]|nr:hypothetical protein [Pseudonocardiales bacterium]
GIGTFFADTLSYAAERRPRGLFGSTICRCPRVNHRSMDSGTRVVNIDLRDGLIGVEDLS